MGDPLRDGRRQDWTLPLSDAAALTGDLGRVNIFYDPYHALDRHHVARFSGDNIRVFNCRHSSHKTAVFLRRMDALKPVMHHAIFDELTARDFYRLYRRRRNLPWFRGALEAHFAERGRPGMAERVTVAFRERLRARKAAEAEPEAAPAPDGGPSRRARPPHRRWLARTGRRARNARRGIVTTMRNEGPFMLEWVAYNRAIGFTDLLIYTNHCDDGTDAIAARLQELGMARHVENVFKAGASPQRVALRRALKQDIYRDCDWVICADCDEFLNIRAGDGTLDALFEAVGEADAISVAWKLFGSGGQAEYADRFVTERFLWAAPEDYTDKYRARGLKTLFRPGAPVVKIGVHRPKFEGRPEGFVWKDAGGQPMPEKFFEAGWSAHAGFSHDHARLHHYAVRSVDSFLVKRERGRTNHIDRDQGAAYWADMNLNMEQDRSILPMAGRARAERERLMADPNSPGCTPPPATGTGAGSPT